MPRGDIAVQLFFIISGFYMALILNTKYKSHTNAFYKNRFLRLYPIYLSVLLVILISGFFSLNVLKQPLNNWNSIIVNLKSGTISLEGAVFLLFSNLTMLFQDVVMFLRIENGNFVPGRFGISDPPIYTMLYMPQAWSISIEIAFYAIAPFIIKRKKTIFFVFLISFLFRLILHILGYSFDPFSYRFFPSEISVFLLGAISWHIFSESQVELLKKYTVHLQILLFVVFIFWPFIFSFNDLGRYLFFAVFAILVPYFHNHYKNSTIDRAIGDLSYPFYLTHIFCFQISSLICTKLFKDLLTTQIIILALSTVLTTAISYLLINYVQDYFEKIRQNITAKIYG